MADESAAVLSAAEGTGAEIAWVVIYVLCWILMIAPFALWWAGVRTPRSERRARRPAAESTDHADRVDTPHATGATGATAEPEEIRTRVAG